MKTLFTIYVNRQDEEIEIPEFLSKRPFVLAVSPAYFIDGKLSKSPGGVEQIKEILKNGVVLGQRGGLTDSCVYSGVHKFFGTDRWHTNFCPYMPFIYSEEKQRENILDGKRLLVRKLNVSPVVYCPINHLFTDRTLDALFGTGLNFILDRNMLGNLPYERRVITIIPEIKIPDEYGRESCAMYCALSDFKDKKKKGEIENILEKRELVYPSNIERTTGFDGDFMRNQVLKIGRKVARDVATATGLR